MADKYIFLDPVTGFSREREGTVTGGTAGQAGDILALDASGRIDESVLPVGLGPDVYNSLASEILTAGAFVYVDSGAEIANAFAGVSGFPALGFVLTPSAIGEPATVYFEGQNNALTGLTPGARYYLSDTTPGGVTTTPVSGTGKKHQYLGNAISTTTIAFERDDVIILA